MSHSYSTQTAAVRGDTAQPSFESREALIDYIDRAVGEALDEDRFRCVFGESRSGWAVYTVKALLQRARISSLSFLTDGGHMYRLDDVHERICVDLVDPEHVGEVLGDLERLLKWLPENRPELLAADTDGCMTDSDIDAAIERDYVSMNPAFDSRVKGEDGQSADYLLTYLRSVRKVFESAQNENRAVLHVLRI